MAPYEFAAMNHNSERLHNTLQDYDGGEGRQLLSHVANLYIDAGSAGNSDGALHNPAHLGEDDVDQGKIHSISIMSRG